MAAEVSVWSPVRVSITSRRIVPPAVPVTVGRAKVISPVWCAGGREEEIARAIVRHAHGGFGKVSC